MTPWWEAVFKVARPGSRTVVCDPPDASLPVELARRGYRLFILHSEGFDIAALRQSLRVLGLSSQLMGAQVYRAGVGVKLVREYYELWLFCGSPSDALWLAAQQSLKRGSAALWQAGLPAAVGGEQMEGLPHELSGCLLP